MVSHEMRNPLNAMMQCAEETSQLTERLKDRIGIERETEVVLNDIEDMINTLLYCGTHQKQLIDDVLTLSKLDSKLLVVYPVKVYPATLLEQAIKVFNSEIRSSKVEVYTSFELDGSINQKEEAFAVMVDRVASYKS